MSNKELEKLHKALASHRRIAMLRFMQGKKDADLLMLAEYVGISYRTTSKHLAQLVSAGIVDRSVTSGVAYFSISKTLPTLAAHTLKYF